MPNFKRFRKTVFGVEFTKVEAAIIDKAIEDLILEKFQTFEKELDAAVLWELHTDFGFGLKRLKKVWQNTYRNHRELQQYYDMNVNDAGWLVSKLLKEYGMDLDALYAEEEAKNV